MGKDFGGRILVTTSTGIRLSLRGTLNLNPSSVSTEAVVNQDNSVDRTATVVARRAELNFSDGGFDYDALMKAPRMNITFIEDFSGVTHYFTGAFFVGDPQTNRQTGEVTGISIAAENYNKG